MEFSILAHFLDFDINTSTHYWVDRLFNLSKSTAGYFKEQKSATCYFTTVRRGEKKGPALNISISQLAPFSSFISCRGLPSKWLIKTGVLRYPALPSDNYLSLKAKDQQALKCLMGQSNKADVCVSLGPGQKWPRKRGWISLPRKGVTFNSCCSNIKKLRD